MLDQQFLSSFDRVGVFSVQDLLTRSHRQDPGRRILGLGGFSGVMGFGTRQPQRRGDEVGGRSSDGVAASKYIEGSHGRCFFFYKKGLCGPSTQRVSSQAES